MVCGRLRMQHSVFGRYGSVQPETGSRARTGKTHVNIVGGRAHILQLLAREDVCSSEVALRMTVLSGLRSRHINDLQAGRDINQRVQSMPFQARKPLRSLDDIPGVHVRRTTIAATPQTSSGQLASKKVSNDRFCRGWDRCGD